MLSSNKYLSRSFSAIQPRFYSYFNNPDYWLTVLCSSPSLTWNVCSKMVYMILPIPNDGSITLGTTSSTVGDKQKLRVIEVVAPIFTIYIYLSNENGLKMWKVKKKDINRLSESHHAESSGTASRWPCPLWVWTSCLLSRWWTLCRVKTRRWLC